MRKIIGENMEFRYLINGGHPLTEWRNCSDVTVKQIELMAKLNNEEVKKGNITDWDIEYRG